MLVRLQGVEAHHEQLSYFSRKPCSMLQLLRYSF
jgi:hypothetical protein